MPIKHYCFYFVLIFILFANVIAKRKLRGKVVYEFNYDGDITLCDDTGLNIFDPSELRMIKDSATTTVMGGLFSLFAPIVQGTSLYFDVYKKTENGKEPSWSFEVLDMCKHVGETGMPWSGVIDEMNLNPRSCPLPMGKFALNNLKLDMSSFSAVFSKESVGGYEATVKIFRSDGFPPKKKLLTCVICRYRIDEVREKIEA